MLAYRSALRVVIPAAGRGTRFLPLGWGTPKEMLPIAGRPLVEHAVREAADAGFDKAVIVVSTAKQAIRDHFAAIDLPIPVEFAVQNEPRGFGDAVRVGAGGEPCGVITPDDYVPSGATMERLLNEHRRTGAAMLSVRTIEPAETQRYGIARFDLDGTVTELVEKPPPGRAPSDEAVFGRYIVSEAVLAALDRLGPGTLGEWQLTDGFAAVLRHPPGVRALRMAGEFYDCGTPEAYAESIRRLTLRRA
ncbi:MAG: UTP--glucose-1-phosphate uridylyltransferase GalU [Candidatus Dormibacteraceae bacterium]